MQAARVGSASESEQVAVARLDRRCRSRATTRRRTGPGERGGQAFLVGAAATTPNLRLRPRPRWDGFDSWRRSRAARTHCKKRCSARPSEGVARATTGPGPKLRAPCREVPSTPVSRPGPPSQRLVCASHGRAEGARTPRVCRRRVHPRGAERGRSRCGHGRRSRRAVHGRCDANGESRKAAAGRAAGAFPLDAGRRRTTGGRAPGRGTERPTTCCGRSGRGPTARRPSSRRRAAGRPGRCPVLRRPCCGRRGTCGIGPSRLRARR